MSLQQYINQAKEEFLELDISGGPAIGDKFFSKYLLGNSILQIDQPFERLRITEQLLQSLREVDSQKYDDIHKGTIFYFLAWYWFDLGNYENGFFYIDAALCEDLRKGDIEFTNPAGQFMRLDTTGDQTAQRVCKEVRKVFDETINSFNKEIGIGNFLKVEDIIEKFVITLLQKGNVSIITAFYAFLLEEEQLLINLRLLNGAKGSIDPFITHLFKGGLVFESILKYLYPMSNGVRCKTLGDIFKNTTFKADFPNITVGTSAMTLCTILNNATGTDIQSTFTTVSRLRNTTGHNLVWDNIFDSQENFKLLSERVMYAILYLIAKKFI